jgi:membrane peptidoglycan carboxypeptidase
VLLGIVIVVGGFVWAYNSITLPTPDDAAFTQTTHVFYADGQTAMGDFSIQNRQIVDIADLPVHVGQAVVAAEDRTFWKNSGVDPVALARAFYNNLRGGQRQGGSTITQQYIERYFVGETTTDLKGKLREAIMAVKVTREKPKSEILGDYLNTIYFGRGAYGIETAAQAYFGIPAKELDVSQAALLAGVIPAPSAWDPAVDEVKCRQRWAYVLDGMVTIEALDHTVRQSLVFPETIAHKVSDLYAGAQGYLLQMVRSELLASGLHENDLDGGGLTIVTTIDKSWQKAAVKAVKNLPKDRPDALEVAAVTIDPADGAIKALYGGADYISRQQNAVTQDIAQAGSTFKPITLAAALETGEHSLSDWYSGRSPMKIGDWRVENLGNTSYGEMSLLRATANSVNTVYAQLNEEIGGQATRDAAVAAGVPDQTVGLDSDLTNVLGTASPHPLDMANVYATFAAGGVRHTPHIVATATDPVGQVIYVGPTQAERVFSKTTMAEVTYALTEVVTQGTGTKAQDLNRPCAAKTGTSEEHRSAWFVGFTPQLATAVAFYQHGSNGDVAELTPFGGRDVINGGDLPAQVWLDLMSAEHADMPVKDFPERSQPRPDNTPDDAASATSLPQPTVSFEQPTVASATPETAEPIDSPTESVTPPSVDPSSPETPVVPPFETPEPTSSSPPAETSAPPA